MASATTPGYFKPYLQEARRAAAAARLHAPYFQMRERADEDLVRTNVWRSGEMTVELATVSGLWSVYLSYEFQTLPGERDLSLVRTSFGLNVSNVSLFPDGSTTLIRYDFDELVDSDPYAEPSTQKDAAPSVAAHINVLQPDPLADHVHLPGFRADRWDAEEVLTWITSQRLLADLRRRLPV